MKRLMIFASVFAIAVFHLNAQEVGIQPFGIYESNIDTVAIDSGTVQLHIPIISYPQKGSLPPKYRTGL